MKKISVLLMVGLICLAGCGAKVIEQDSNGGPASTQVQQNNGGTQQGKGYVFVNKGVTIAMDDDMASIQEALGEPLNYFEAASCAFEGLDKIYTYGGFVIHTYPKDGIDRVASLVLKDDSVATPEGITIGSTKEKALSAYSGEAQTDENSVTYQKDGMKLVIIFSDDVVSSIQFFSSAI